LNPADVAQDVQGSSPRLLVDLKAEDATRAAIDRALPGVPWAFTDASPPDQRDAVEAMLVGALGSLAGGVGDFDVRTTPRLRFVQRILTGLDGFPFDRFPPQVAVAGNVGAFAPFVAEQAITLSLAAARDLGASLEMVRAGRLRPTPEQRTLVGATAAVLGYGAIGAEIGRRLTGLGARVVGANRTGAPAPGVERMVDAEHFRDVLAGSDLVFEVRPLTRRTAGTIGRAELSTMRDDAILVNVGRAATVDPAALYAHLTAHPHFRAAFDVWWQEDFRAGTIVSPFPFASLPNFLGTPHSAGAVPAARPRALAFALENLARFFQDGHPLYVAVRSDYSD
jgi:phosphoglycerate dehydrogenase-like enzyme